MEKRTEKISHYLTKENNRTQSVESHLKNTAAYAQKCLSKIGLKYTAYLAGLIHDMGKYSNEFQMYLEKSAKGIAVKKGSVNHTFAGVRLALEESADQMSAEGLLTGEIVAYGAGSHHAAFDCLSKDGTDGFSHRINAPIPYIEDKSDFFNSCIKEGELKILFEKSVMEISEFLKLLQARPSKENGKRDVDEMQFHIGLLARLIQSAVIEGDRRDTAEFYEGYKREEKEAKWENILQYTEKKISALNKGSTIQEVRSALSNLCRQAADKETGIYALNMPTGSGKTLSSLRFALAHASKNKLERIIYVSPFLGIIDQNAVVIREYIGNDAIITEHHSDTADKAGWDLYKENWRSPIVITTMFQFLMTLFSSNPSNIRRMQSLCKSVIIFDEVQSVPVKVMSMFYTAMDFLASMCGATIILCSATQPVSNACIHPMRCIKGDLIQISDKWGKVFTNKEFQYAGSMCLNAIPNFLEGLTVQSLLVICNTKKEAEFLYKTMCGRKQNTFFLSAGMCSEHRRDVLEYMRNAMENGPVLCISTQVMEAGIDISFPCVVRFMAGLDSMIQAGGRCNRDGLAGHGTVYLINCIDENLSTLPEIQHAKNTTMLFIKEFEQTPEKFGNRMDSKESIGFYFEHFLQSIRKSATEYPLPDGSTIFGLMSSNAKAVPGKVPRYMRQAFKQAGDAFSVYGTDAVSVLVPYKEGEALIQKLRDYLPPSMRRYYLRKAAGYQASIYPAMLDQLINKKAVEVLQDGTFLVLSGVYYGLTGVTI